MIDFSNYSTNSKFYDNLNKLVVGKMKDETAGVPIKEFVLNLIEAKNVFVLWKWLQWRKKSRRCK